MVSYVSNDMADAEEWKADEIQAVIAAMAAEAGFADPKTPKELIEQGRDLITDGERCSGCHTFHDNGIDYGAAPDITRWGSKEWLVGIITDPTHERFYGDTNDRMPSFGKGEDGAATILSREQIDLLADWLRGEWYRPASH